MPATYFYPNCIKLERQTLLHPKWWIKKKEVINSIPAKPNTPSQKYHKANKINFSKLPDRNVTQEKIELVKEIS